MTIENDEVQVSKIEVVLVIGIIGCLLFATWELGHLMADEWFRDWVRQNSFVNRRIILYGIAFFMAILSVITTTSITPKAGRFASTVSRAFLWYGTLLLISTIAIFVFDCLPEVFAGFIGAGIFIAAIYIVQKRFFTQNRVLRTRINKGQCPKCNTTLQPRSYFCSSCGETIGERCRGCNGYNRIVDRYCSNCGKPLSKNA
jgi:hypothetical protein